MTPEQAAVIQSLLRTAANALEDLKLSLHTECSEGCPLVADLLASLSGRFPEEILRDYAVRCEDYFED